MGQFTFALDHDQISEISIKKSEFATPPFATFRKNAASGNRPSLLWFG